MKTAVASADDESPKKKFGIGLPKKPSKGTYGLSDSDRGIGLPERKKPMYVETKKKDKPKTAAAGSPPPKNPPKGPKVNDKMKVVPLKQKTVADQERQKAKAKESLKKNTNRKKK